MKAVSTVPYLIALPLRKVSLLLSERALRAAEQVLMLLAVIKEWKGPQGMETIKEPMVEAGCRA